VPGVSRQKQGCWGRGEHLNVMSSDALGGRLGTCWHVVRAARKGMGNTVGWPGAKERAGKTHLQANLCKVAVGVEGSIKAVEVDVALCKT